MTDIKHVSKGDRLFIRNPPKHRPRLVVVDSVDHEGGSFVTTTGETVRDMDLVEGWDLAGDIFSVPKDR